MILPPFEFLVNCGKITLILYEVQNTSFDLEGDIVSNNYNLFDYSILIVKILIIFSGYAQN